MMSCFEGLLEYYRITGKEWQREAVIRFADRILESDFTVIGCCGCTHELFDHSTVRQANTTNGKIMQETCVTVTLMKFFYQLNLLTGDVRYADAFEISLYNAYLGAINTEKVIEPTVKAEHPDWCIEPLPFDSYSPLTAGTRGNGIGGLKLMSDNHYYGCCACIGSAGIGLVPKMQMLTTEKGLVMNLFLDGIVETKTPKGRRIVLETRTEYPRMGRAVVTVHMESEEAFELLIRNPKWSCSTGLLVNGERMKVTEGYLCVTRSWREGDKIELNFDMRVKAVYPIPYGEQILMNEVIWGHNYMVSTFDREDMLAKKHIAFQRGPIMLAQENRLGYSVDTPVTFLVREDGYVEGCLPDEDIAPYPHMVELQLPLSDGSYKEVIMAQSKRKDKSRVVLRKGEVQRANGSYHYCWTSKGKRHFVYAKTLEELREKEDGIQKDKLDGIKVEAKYTTINDLFDLWAQLKRGLKDNTFENYKYMYDTFVRPELGKQRISSLKKSDVKRFYNRLADDRGLKTSTIDSIHTVLHI